MHTQDPQTDDGQTDERTDLQKGATLNVYRLFLWRHKILTFGFPLLPHNKNSE